MRSTRPPVYPFGADRRCYRPNAAGSSGAREFLPCAIAACRRFAVITSIVFATVSAPRAQDGNQTAQDIQRHIDQLKEQLALEQKRGDEAYRRLWTGADASARGMVDYHLGLFGLGSIDEYEKFTKTVEEANRAWRVGDRSTARARVADAVKQARDVASRKGILSPSLYRTIPRTPQEVKEFIDAVSGAIKRTGADARNVVTNLALTGNASETLEDSNLAQSNIKNQIGRLENELIIRRETFAGSGQPALGRPTPLPDNATSNSPARFVAPPAPTTAAAISPTELYEFWRDSGDRAFDNMPGAKERFYRVFPELRRRYGDTAEWSSPSSEVERDIANGSLNLSKLMTEAIVANETLRASVAPEEGSSTGARNLSDGFKSSSEISNAKRGLFDQNQGNVAGHTAAPEEKGQSSLSSAELNILLDRATRSVDNPTPLDLSASELNTLLARTANAPSQQGMSSDLSPAELNALLVRTAGSLPRPPGQVTPPSVVDNSERCLLAKRSLQQVTALTCTASACQESLNRNIPILTRDVSEKCSDAATFLNTLKTAPKR